MREFGYNVALVGASSLKGKEVKEALEASAFPLGRLALLDDDQALGQLTEFQGEPTFIRTVGRESFEGMDFAIFCSTPAFTRAHWKEAGERGCHLIDLSYALEDEPSASLEAPLFNAECGMGNAESKNIPNSPPQAGHPHCISVCPHPAALAVATVLERVAARFPVARAVVNIFEPASERGREGVEELHQQTVSLLSFHKIPQKVFDRQLAFDLLATGGAEMRPTLEETERLIARHVQALLAGHVTRPSLRLAQAATFHGHSFSFYLELGPAGNVSPAVEAVAQALRGPGIDLRPAGEDAPSATGAAGSSDILIGDLRPDRACAGAFWLWGAADNLRLLALNAVALLRSAIKNEELRVKSEE